MWRMYFVHRICIKYAISIIMKHFWVENKIDYLGFLWPCFGIRIRL